MARHLLLRAILGALAMIALLPAHARAQASEDAIKAAFLPKFVRYISLPAAAQPTAAEPYYLCVIGRDPFGTLIDKSAGSETVDGHAVAVRRFADADAPAIAGCDIAFVAGTGTDDTAKLLDTVQRQPVLTVTDSRFGDARGIIHFVISGGRVRFTIDKAQADARGITISSRLLALAIDVKQSAP